jgi:hypothetical protein
MPSHALREHIDLVESLSYRTFLTESQRAEFLLKTYGPKIEPKFAAEQDSEPAHILQGIRQMPGQTEAAQVISFLMAHDPTRNHQYSQWLVVRYVRGDLRLEDLERAHQYLEVFTRAKPRLARKDINQYRSLAEVYEAVAPFMENNEPVSQRAADAAVDRRMHQEDQAEVVWNDDELKVVVPKTQESSCYFGRNTQWCTAATRSTNYFSHYSKDGPLFVILLKKTNTRYQFHAESRQFKDESDQEVPAGKLKTLLQRNPKIVKAVGEDRLVSMIGTLGIGFFSRQSLERANPEFLLGAVNSQAEWNALPDSVRARRDVMISLIKQKPGTLSWFPEAAYRDALPEIAQANHRVIQFIPQPLITQEIADAVLPQAHDLGYFERIPEHMWSAESRTRYWEIKVRTDRNLHLADVPTEFLSLQAIVECLHRFPDEIPRYTDLLDESIVVELIKKRAYSYSGETSYSKLVGLLPETLRTAAVAANIPVNHRTMGRDTDGRDPFLLFPPSVWPEAIMEDRLARGQVPYSLFQQLPPEQQTDKLLLQIVKGMPEEAAKVPREFWDHGRLFQAIFSNPRILRWIDPTLVTDDLLCDLLGHKDANSYSKGYVLFENFRPEWLTPAVKAALADYNIARLPDGKEAEWMEQNALRNVTVSTAKAFDVPPWYHTKEFALKAFHEDMAVIRLIPVELFSTELLEAFLAEYYTYKFKRYDDRKDGEGSDARQFARFPESLWTPETVAKAVRRKLIKADLSVIPERFQTSKVLAAVLEENKDLITDMSILTRIDDADLAKVIEKSYFYDKKVPTERITEPVGYAIVHLGYGIEQIPPKVRSRRIYRRCVGKSVDLNKVPKKFVNDDMMLGAVRANPAQIRFVPNGIEWLTANAAQFHTADEEWLQKLEQGGITRAAKAFVYNRDLPSAELTDGYTLHTSLLGRTTRRMFVLDPAGETKACLYVKGGKLKIWPPKPQDLEPALRDVAVNHLDGIDIKPLNAIGIYRGKDGTITAPEKLVRKTVEGIEWSETRHLKGEMHTAWIDGKPVLKIYVYATGGWGSSYRSDKMQTLEYLDIAACRANAAAIRAGLRQVAYDPGNAVHSLRDMGINHYGDRGGYYLEAETLLGKSDDLDLYYNKEQRTLLIYNPEHLVAFAKMRTTGTFSKEQIYGWKDKRGEDYYKKLLGMMRDKITKKS